MNLWIWWVLLSVYFFITGSNRNHEFPTQKQLTISSVFLQIVYDKDTFTSHDKMGDAKIDIKPFLEVHKMGLQELPDGTEIKRVVPNRENCLAEASSIVSNNGKIVQNMILLLRNVECGEVEIQLEWIDIPGSRGLWTYLFLCVIKKKLSSFWVFRQKSQ